MPATRGDNSPLLISVQRWSAGEGSGWRIMRSQGLGGPASRGGGAAPGVALVVNNVGTEGQHSPLDPVSLQDPESLAKGDLVTAPPQSPHAHWCWHPLGLGEDDAPSTWEFSKPRSQQLTEHSRLCPKNCLYYKWAGNWQRGWLAEWAVGRSRKNPASHPGVTPGASSQWGSA